MFAAWAKSVPPAATGVGVAPAIAASGAAAADACATTSRCPAATGPTTLTRPSGHSTRTAAAESRAPRPNDST
jgi:hypothetical protein